MNSLRKNWFVREKMIPVYCKYIPVLFVLAGFFARIVAPVNAQPVSPLRYTVAPKLLFTLKNENGIYSDVTEGDYQENGQTYRNENGRKYRVFYWINEIPYGNSDDTPKAFVRIPMWPGQTLSLRKVYVDSGWKRKFQEVISSGWETWYQNPQADPDRIWKTVLLAVTTAGGEELKEGEVHVKRNPGWLNAGKLIPQFFFNPAQALPDKPVAIQCFPALQNQPELTLQKLKSAGVTHVWDMALYNQGFFAGNWKPSRLNRHGIGRAQMLGTQGLGAMFPGLKPYGGQLTEQQAEQWANSIPLDNNMVITDEFAEGTYPQFDQSREWFYRRLSQRITSEGYKNVQLLGEYGYGSVRLGMKKDPLSGYSRAILGPEIAQRLEVADGSSDTGFRNFIQNASAYRGNCVGSYYAINHAVQDWIVGYPYNAIVQYNGVPSRPKMVFTWAGMQSNTVMMDVPQRDSGTRHPNGSVTHNFPDTPPEIMKVMGFFGLLFFDSVYLWDAYGTPNALDENAFNNCGISQDGWILGTRWYSELIPALDEADRMLLAANYSAEGVAFTSSSSEMRISRQGKQYFNNSYFNEVAKLRKGMAIVIPAVKPRFIYINPYKSPLEKERVVVKYNDRSYDLGEIPGMTLIVSE